MKTNLAIEVKLVCSILVCSIFFTFLNVPAARSDSHNSIGPEDLSVSSDELFGTSIALISTYKEFIIFAAFALRLSEVIGLEEEWSPTSQYDFLVAVSAPNIQAGRELPVFLNDFRNAAVLEAIAETDVAASDCNISTVEASTGEKVLLILSNHNPQTPNDSFVCLLNGLSIWTGEHQGSNDVNSIRRSFIRLID